MLAILAAIVFALGAILAFIGVTKLSFWGLIFLGLALLAVHIAVGGAIGIPWRRNPG